MYLVSVAGDYRQRVGHHFCRVLLLHSLNALRLNYHLGTIAVQALQTLLSSVGLDDNMTTH